MNMGKMKRSGKDKKKLSGSQAAFHHDRGISPDKARDWMPEHCIIKFTTTRQVPVGIVGRINGNFTNCTTVEFHLSRSFHQAFQESAECRRSAGRASAV